MLYRTRGGNLEEISGPVAWQTKTRTKSSTVIDETERYTHFFHATPRLPKTNSADENTVKSNAEARTSTNRHSHELLLRPRHQSRHKIEMPNFAITSACPCQ